MTKVKTLDDLRKLREGLQSNLTLRERSSQAENNVQIRISMATCGIASGAKETMNLFIEKLDAKGVSAVVTQTGCMGFCHSEPTIEVTLPNEKPIMFGKVKGAKIDEIIDRYIINGELVDGIIPDTFRNIE